MNLQLSQLSDYLFPGVKELIKSEMNVGVKEETVKEEFTIIEEKYDAEEPPVNEITQSLQSQNHTQSEIAQSQKHAGTKEDGDFLNNFSGDCKSFSDQCFGEEDFEAVDPCQIKEKTVKKVYQCNECPYKTTYSANFKQFQTVHSGNKPFSCTDCFSRFSTKRSLTRHLQIHSADKSYFCTICSFKTANISSLKEHKLAHSNNKLFVCQACPYKTTNEKYLKHHKNIHSGVKYFKCDSCPYSTVRKCNLKKHQKTHSDGSFSCDQCPYKAHTMSQLEQHICTHSGEKIFACDKCPFRATQRFILKHHVALKHSGTAEESCTKAVGETVDIKN